MAGQDDRTGIEIGRVHLRVGDLERALAFYRDVLGLGVALRVGDSRLYLTATGHHHHVVLHADAGPLASPRPVSRFSLRYPDRRALAAVAQRISQARVPVDEALDLGTEESLSLLDPDGHRVELYYERQGSDYPRTSSGEIRMEPRTLDLEALRGAVGAHADDQTASDVLSEVTRSRLREMRVRLLNLHKVLLDDARAAYEMDRGQVRSTANLLQLVINDPWFAWLHPLSELVVRIDEVLQPDAPATEADAGVLLEQVARLLTPGAANGRFAERYYEALQRQPAVIVAHAEVRRILKETR